MQHHSPSKEEEQIDYNAFKRLDTLKLTELTQVLEHETERVDSELVWLFRLLSADLLKILD